MAIETNVKLLRNRRTKIVATLGPSSDTPEMIEKLINAGVSVFRLNMSHGVHEKHRETYNHVRAVTKRLNSPVAVLADLCGPKIRVGRFPGGSIELTKGDTVTVTTREVEGNESLIPSQYDALAGDVVEGDRILLDDGNIELTVLTVDGTEISCRVCNSGRLKDHKGMNLPGVDVSTPSLTEKDHADARFALDLGVDFMALSFVRRPEDIQDLRDVMAEVGKSADIIAKIEKPEALENIDGIIEATDGIMVARGDLGVELPPQTVPLAQAQLIDRARTAHKPVIVATQMLESMIDNPRPTRAEVTDVSNAVQGGADAVMLSAESAAGNYPVQAVDMMDDIIRQTESYLWQQGAFSSFRDSHDGAQRPIPVTDAIAESAALLSRELLVRAIMIAGENDDTAAIISASRPSAPMIMVTPYENVMRVANLLWGVIPKLIDPTELDDPKQLAERMTNELNLQYGEPTVLVVKGLIEGPIDGEPTIIVVEL